jgi:hypothetical protein
MADILGTISKLTYFPNGLAQGTIAVIGAAAGDITVTGIKTTDTLLAVEAITFGGGLPTAVQGLTSEFTISADDTINNTGGTATTNMLVLVTVALGKPR